MTVRVPPLAALLLSVWSAAAMAAADITALFDGAMLPDQQVTAQSHTDLLLPVDRVSRGGAVRPLPPAPTRLAPVRFQSAGKDYDFYDYLALNRVAGLLVLKDGKVACEDYELGTGPQTRWSSFSMAKSVSSTLIGAALQQGLIKSLDDPVTAYVPALRGGVYDEVSIRQLLMMASGVKWDETYTDPASDRRKLLDIQLAREPGSILAYMKGLGRAGPPGSIWNYSTGETFVVGAVIEGATHKSLATYLSETIWSRLGMEQDATWWVESPGGMGLAGSGLGASLRDYGRFAQMVAEDGVIDGKRIVPEGWFQEAGRAHVVGTKTVPYGYQWWTPVSADPIHQSAFLARGIFGQRIYINPRQKTVIVILSARPKPTGPAAGILDDEAFYAAVTKALQTP